MQKKAVTPVMNYYAKLMLKLPYFFQISVWLNLFTCRYYVTGINIYHLTSVHVGSDFELPAGSSPTGITTIEFQPTDQTISGTINITDDNIFEPAETILFQLSRPTGSPAELGSIQSTTVTIQDNEGAHHIIFHWLT